MLPLHSWLFDFCAKVRDGQAFFFKKPASIK
jgi:hypothetical protein